MNHSGRQIVHTHIFESQLKKFDDQELISRVVEIVEWAIYRDPERGSLIPGTDFRAWPVFYRGMPYLVYYQVTSDEIHFASIVERTPDFEQ